VHEWMIDIPAIGDIYRNAKSIFCYFNSLGLEDLGGPKALEE